MDPGTAGFLTVEKKNQSLPTEFYLSYEVLIHHEMTD